MKITVMFGSHVLKGIPISDYQKFDNWLEIKESDGAISYINLNNVLIYTIYTDEEEKA